MRAGRLIAAAGLVGVSLFVVLDTPAAFGTARIATAPNYCAVAKTLICFNRNYVAYSRVAAEIRSQLASSGAEPRPTLSGCNYLAYYGSGTTPFVPINERMQCVVQGSQQNLNTGILYVTITGIQVLGMDLTSGQLVTYKYAWSPTQ